MEQNNLVWSCVIAGTVMVQKDNMRVHPGAVLDIMSPAASIIILYPRNIGVDKICVRLSEFCFIMIGLDF